MFDIISFFPRAVAQGIPQGPAPQLELPGGLLPLGGGQIAARQGFVGAEGSGEAYSQDPDPGDKVMTGTTVTVKFQ